jgi:hypothetical protein
MGRAGSWAIGILAALAIASPGDCSEQTATGAVALNPDVTFHDNRSDAGCTYYTNPSGKAEGVMTLFYPDNHVRCKQSFHNGERDGMYMSYNEDGTLIASGKCVMGVPVGMWLGFDAKGQCTSKIDADALMAARRVPTP